jgi:hypothetical protein
VLAGDVPEVLDEGRDVVLGVENLGGAVDLDPRSVPVVGQDEDTDLGSVPCVARLGSLGIGRDHDAAGGVHATGDR